MELKNWNLANGCQHTSMMKRLHQRCFQYSYVVKSLENEQCRQRVFRVQKTLDTMSEWRTQCFACPCCMKQMNCKQAHWQMPKGSCQWRAPHCIDHFQRHSAGTDFWPHSMSFSVTGQETQQRGQERLGTKIGSKLWGRTSSGFCFVLRSLPSWKNRYFDTGSYMIVWRR